VNGKAQGFKFVIASEARQSIETSMDCFVALLLAMTTTARYALTAASPGTAAKPALWA
jgi:hypothetical protein